MNPEPDTAPVPRHAPADTPPHSRVERRRAEIEQNYHEILDNLNEGVFKTDERGRFTYLNHAWIALIGRPLEEMLGRFCGHLVHPDDRRTFRSEFISMLHGALPVHRCDVRLMRADGGWCWVQLSVRRFCGPQGETLGLTGTAVDISTSRRVQEQLIAARQEAEAASRAKTEFLSTMSHELRTPLNAVIGLAESLLETGAPFEPARTQRYLGMIKDGGHQLLGQINLILDLARLESGRIRVNASYFDLGALCVTALDSVHRHVQAKSLKIELQRPPGPLSVWADERLIWQALIHLLNNAIKFTPSRGTLYLSASPHERDQVAVVVRDTGIGIAAEKMHLLFQPFSQVDSSLSRRFGGTGLGLTLVDRFIRLHGGTVQVESAQGVGTTFTLLLPKGCPPVVGEPAARQESPPSRPDAGGGPSALARESAPALAERIGV